MFPLPADPRYGVQPSGDKVKPYSVKYTDAQLSQFLEGYVQLQKVKSKKLIVFKVRLAQKLYDRLAKMQIKLFNYVRNHAEYERDLAFETAYKEAIKRLIK